MSPTDQLIQAARAATSDLSPVGIKAMLAAPTIIVSAPRSGSNLLFELLSKVEDIWTVGGESHGIFRVFPHLRAENAQLDSGSLLEAHADPDTGQLMRAIFLYLLRDRQGRSYIMLPAEARPATLNVLEKTPRNALNIPFLLRVFPRAKFIFLHRDPRATVASLAEAWKAGLQSGQFVTFKNLPGWDRPAWCFLLPPGWRSMIGKSLVEIAAFQWAASNSVILDQLATLPSARWTSVSYASLLDDPGGVRASLSNFVNAELTSDSRPISTLPLSRTTLTPPHPDKWKKYEQEITALLPSLQDVCLRISETCKAHQP